MSSPQEKSRNRGRAAEYRLAKLVHGKVCGRSKAIILDSGKAIKVDPQHPCDVVTELFAFENKHFQELPVWLDEIMLQAKTNCPDGLIPVAHVGNRKAREYYFILSEKDFLDLLIGDTPQV